jgi:hypothetical protein
MYLPSVTQSNIIDVQLLLLRFINKKSIGKAIFYLKLADTIARYKSRNLRPRNRIGRLKNRNLKRTDTIGRYKNRNLTSTDCIVRYNGKIESVSEDQSIGPFAHLCIWPFNIC